MGLGGSDEVSVSPIWHIVLIIFFYFGYFSDFRNGNDKPWNVNSNHSGISGGNLIFDEFNIHLKINTTTKLQKISRVKISPLIFVFGEVSSLHYFFQRFFSLYAMVVARMSGCSTVQPVSPRSRVSQLKIEKFKARNPKKLF